SSCRADPDSARSQPARGQSEDHAATRAVPGDWRHPRGLRGYRALPRPHLPPPGRVRRFETRFFTADASAITYHVPGVVHGDAELVELVWVEIGSKPLADLHAMTKNVLNELEKRLV